MGSISDLVTYLPGIPQPYWQRYIFEITPTSNTFVAPGATTSLLPNSILKQRGIINFTALTTNSYNGTMHLIVDGRTLTTNLQEIHEAGPQGFAVNNLPYILVWNTTKNIYSIIWQPIEPFNDNVTVELTNTGTTPMTIDAFIVEIYLFKDGFYEQLSKLKYSAILDKINSIHDQYMDIKDTINTYIGTVR